MQGRITKVINMKPPEVLSMLEEAAGTRMYESKKDAAMKTLVKKEAKVEEINAVLGDEILPALEKLRGERAKYIEWTNINSKLERLRRFCIAYDYTVALETMKEACGKKESLTLKANGLATSIEDLEGAILDKDAAIEKLKEEKAASMGGDMVELKEKEGHLSKELVKYTTIMQNKQDAIAGEEKSKKELEADLKKQTQAIESSKSQHAAALQECQAAKIKAQEQAELAVKIEAELTGISASGADGSTKTLAETLADVKAKASAAESELKQLKTKLKHTQKEAATCRKKVNSSSKENSALAGKIDAMDAQIKDLENSLATAGPGQARADELAKAIEKCNNKISELKQQALQLTSSLNMFNENDCGFDTSKVKGVVGRLVHVKNKETMTALEVVAGSKLYNVVVDSDDTGKALLKKKLRNRITIIPLNRIDSTLAKESKQHAAKKLVGSGNVSLALELVGYDDELENAMRYVFGKTFVCPTAETAKKVAFDRDVLTNTVTYEGDVFNPAGTITGGSRAKGNSLLERLSQVAKLEEELAQETLNLQKLSEELGIAKKATSQSEKLQAKLELLTHERSLLQQRLEASEDEQARRQLAALEAEEAQIEQSLVTTQESKESLTKEAADIEYQINNFAKVKESREKEAKDKIKASKAEKKKAEQLARTKANEAEKLALEIKSQETEVESMTDQLATVQEAIKKLTIELEELTGQVGDASAKYESVKNELDERMKVTHACEKQINSCTKEKSKIEKKLSDAKVDLKKTEQKLIGIDRDATEAEATIELFTNRHAWVESEKDKFGVPDSEYDFESEDPIAAKSELKKAESAQDKLAKNVNKKVMTMFDKAEQEYRELEEKKRIVLNDKAKIEKAIRELDDKKREVLFNTWQKVTKDFGSIFSTLLPGTTAKLEPPEGDDFLAGLELKVAFGGVWKQSLSELSGGQRSLLALSLILALLLFKPAPIYILDEVDAALDLSHTQNIGRMIKTHFPYSQFIVVSLKEGMFSNANVIFRTKFVDGVSTITRTVPKQQVSEPHLVTSRSRTTA
eukprot:scaffold2455_cov387-Prasinococcus_capsulatus_cf.AAC.15